MHAFERPFPIGESVSVHEADRVDDTIEAAWDISGVNLGSRYMLPHPVSVPVL